MLCFAWIRNDGNVLTSCSELISFTTVSIRPESASPDNPLLRWRRGPVTKGRQRKRQRRYSALNVQNRSVLENNSLVSQAVILRMEFQINLFPHWPYEQLGLETTIACLLLFRQTRKAFLETRGRHDAKKGKKSLFYIKMINSKFLLWSTGNFVQYLVIAHIYICKTMYQWIITLYARN